MRRKTIIIIVAIISLGFLFQLTSQYAFYWFLGVMGTFTILALFDIIQVKNSILKNFPLFGHLRYIFKNISPEIRQYFVEGNTDGSPFNKNQIDLVNSRAEMKLENHPFGTEMNLYEDGHEWVAHSQFPSKLKDKIPRVKVGNSQCTKPYHAALLNVSAMSYGSLSSRAIESLNGGAKIGGFYHNTGEGSLSPFHIKPGGDIVWQIGTGYFGCRTKDGKFDPKVFQEKSAVNNVKMIEIKLSQGAKPGHGGILPAVKNTVEIAKIRGVEPHTLVHSPPYHSTFSDPEGLMHFVKELRDLSGGKPVGFKLCVGSKKEIEDICQAMIKTEIKADFITVDGAEGGTGAAPLEFSNHIGMPGEEAVTLVSDMLRGYDLKKEVKIIFSGKVITGFDIIRAISAGADFCNSARGMMFALGCIQSLKCNSNICPTGIATQNKNLEKGINVNLKTIRVANFQKETVKSAVEILAAMGLCHSEELNRTMLFQWSGENNRSMTLDEIYPTIKEGSFLNRMSKQPL